MKVPTLWYRYVMALGTIGSCIAMGVVLLVFNQASDEVQGTALLLVFGSAVYLIVLARILKRVGPGMISFRREIEQWLNVAYGYEPTRRQIRALSTPVAFLGNDVFPNDLRQYNQGGYLTRFNKTKKHYYISQSTWFPLDEDRHLAAGGKPLAVLLTIKAGLPYLEITHDRVGNQEHEYVAFGVAKQDRGYVREVNQAARIMGILMGILGLIVFGILPIAVCLLLNLDLHGFWGQAITGVGLLMLQLVALAVVSTLRDSVVYKPVDTSQPEIQI